MFVHGAMLASGATWQAARPRPWTGHRQSLRCRRVLNGCHAVMLILAGVVGGYGGWPFASGCRGLRILRLLVLSWRCWVWRCPGLENPNPRGRQESALCGGCAAVGVDCLALAASVDVAVELVLAPLTRWAYYCWRRQGLQSSSHLVAV